MGSGRLGWRNTGPQWWRRSMKMKRCKVRLDQIADADNLREAFLRAARGKGHRGEVIAFRENLAAELAALRAGILAGTVVVGQFTAFTIHEPKERRIHAPCFRERVLHHALIGPCEADFGLFGPMFRHFSHDPTPSAILRERAPNVLAWTMRVWAATPDSLSSCDRVGGPPDDLNPLLRCIGADYLPYLEANLKAVSCNLPKVRFQSFGGQFEVPASPYRAACLLELRRQYALLSPAEQAAIATRLGGEAMLVGQIQEPILTPPSTGHRITNRHWI